MNTTTGQARLAELKRRVARGEYTVDAGLVADEILERLRLVGTVRRQLVADTETQRAQRARPRSRRRFEAPPEDRRTPRQASRPSPSHETTRRAVRAGPRTGRRRPLAARSPVRRACSEAADVLSHWEALARGASACEDPGALVPIRRLDMRLESPPTADRVAQHQGTDASRPNPPGITRSAA